MAMDMERYYEGLAKGLTGRALADYIGVQAPELTPVDQPPAGPIIPQISGDSVYVNEPIENIVARQRGIQVPYVTAPQPAVQAPEIQSPIDESKNSIKEAMQLIGMRGFQQDVGIGIPQHVALAKWFPVMAVGTTGAASTYKAMQPGGQELIQQEVAPGKTAVFRPGGSTVQIVSTGPKTQDQMMQLKRRTDIMRALQDIEPTSPGYTSLTNELSRLDQQIGQEAVQPPVAQAAPVAPVIPSQPVRKPFSYIGANAPERIIEARQAVEAPVVAPAKAAVSPLKRFRYNKVTRKLEALK